MKNFFIYGTITVLGCLLVNYFMQTKSYYLMALDVIMATHIIYDPSPEEQAKKIEAFKNEPPFTQKDLETALKIMPTLAQARGGNNKLAEAIIMRFKYVGAKIQIAMVAINDGGQDAEAILNQTKMPSYLRPTATEMALVRKNKDIINKSKVLPGQTTTSTQTYSARTHAKMIENLKQEPPLTPKDLDIFISLMPLLTQTNINKDKASKFIEQNDLSPVQIQYILTKVPIIFMSILKGGEEHVYAIQSQIPEYLRATPSEVDLIIKNQEAIGNIYLEVAKTHLTK